jgi:hypothetical protein
LIKKGEKIPVFHEWRKTFIEMGLVKGVEEVL